MMNFTLLIRMLVLAVVVFANCLAIGSSEIPRIYLVGSELDLEHSKLLYSFDEFRSEDWTVFRHGAEKKWEFRGKTLAGGGFATASTGEQEGYFGFGFYHSYCEYANLRVWCPKFGARS